MSPHIKDISVILVMFLITEGFLGDLVSVSVTHHCSYS